MSCSHLNLKPQDSQCQIECLQEAGEEVSEGRKALNAHLASVCRPLSSHDLPHKDTVTHLRRQPEQTDLATAPGAAAIHNTNVGPTGNGHEPTESAQPELDTGKSKSILQSLLQHISPEHEWRRQLEQVMGLHNMMNAMIACVQESDIVHKQDAHSEQAERAASAFAVKVCQQHARRMKNLAAAALAAVFAFARHQVIAGPSLLVELERLPLSQEEYTSALEQILQSLRAQQQDEPQSWSPEVLQTCEKAQKAIKHAIDYEHEIAEEMQQHAQTLQESAKRVSAQLEQLKSAKSPGTTSAQPVSPPHAAEAKVSPAAALGTNAHSSANQSKPPKVKQKQASPIPSIAAKGKPKRIEWDAQVAAATNAQTLRAAALASHAEKVNASKAEAAMSKPLSSASQKRRATESKPSAAPLSNTKPPSPASQKRRAIESKPSAAPLGNANVSQGEGEAAGAKALCPPVSQKRKAAARKLCAAPVAGANDQSESKATSAQAAATAAATAPQLQRSKPLLPASVPATEAADQQSLGVNEALSDTPQEAADTAVAYTDRPDKLSAQALVEAFPQTPPGTPPDTPQKAKATTTAVQPASKRDSAPQVGNPAEPASMHTPETIHGGGDDASVLWQGVLSWSWGPGAAAKGTFASSLTHVMTFPPGCRWHDGESPLHLLKLGRLALGGQALTVQFS